MMVLLNSALSRWSSAEDFLRALRVELAGGLVQQDERRVGHDGARDGDALLLPAGELTRDSGRAGRRSPTTPSAIRTRSSRSFFESVVSSSGSSTFW